MLSSIDIFSFYKNQKQVIHKSARLVIKNTGSWYSVKTDDGRIIESKIKGKFRLQDIKSTNPVAVGDRVELQVNNEGTAFITAIEDRKKLYCWRKSQNLK